MKAEIERDEYEDAYREITRKKHYSAVEFGIQSGRRVGDELVLEINANKATYRGCKFKHLNRQAVRKFENLLVSLAPHLPVKMYVTY